MATIVLTVCVPIIHSSFVTIYVHMKASSLHIKILTLTAIIVFLIAGLLFSKRAQAPISQDNNSDNTTQNIEFNKDQFSKTDPTSTWVIVNKKHSINPLSFAPENLVDLNLKLDIQTSSGVMLRDDVADSLADMLESAKNAGIDLVSVSGYRSFDTQKTVYGNYVSTDGTDNADKYSARPGHSEHQTGLAIDIGADNGTCELEKCFSETPEGKWLAENSLDYGFLLRYPSDKELITGYEFEPWHFRFVGKELAAEMKNNNITTLEEFFSVSGGLDYAEI